MQIFLLLFKLYTTTSKSFGTEMNIAIMCNVGWSMLAHVLTCLHHTHS